MAKGVADARHGKGLSKGEANENERKNFTEESYRRLNQQPFNNYDFSRLRLNFEIVKGKIVPLGSQPKSMYFRYLDALKNIDFKAYKDGATNQQNTYAGLLFSGSTEHMQRIAFGEQEVDYTRNPEQWKNWNVTRSEAIEQWAMDTYNFVCEMYGEENILAFDVHLDETAPHIHCKIVPTAIKQQRGNVSGYHKVDAEGNPVTYTKGKHVGEVIKISESKYNALSDEKKKEYRKNERGTVRTISYATYFGRTLEERSQKLSELHTQYYEKVGKKWGLERGDVIAELPLDEQLKRKHLTKTEAYKKALAERRAKVAEEQAKAAEQKADDAIAERDAAVQRAEEQKKIVDDNDQRIGEQNQIINDNDMAISNQETIIADNEAEIEEQKKTKGENETAIEQQSTVLKDMREEHSALEDAIAEKKQEQERLNTSSWLDTMKGLVNKSDKDKKYLAEIARLEKEALAVDGSGKPVLYKSGNQASWPRYAELLRSMIQREKEKVQPAVDAAVAETNKQHQATVAKLNTQISSLKKQLTERDDRIDELEKEKKTLLERIKALKEAFIKAAFGPKFRAAVNAIIERFNDNLDRFTRPQKATIETILATENTVADRKALGKEAVDMAHVLTEDKDKWTVIPAEVDEIAEEKWEENQARVEKRAVLLDAAVDAVVSMGNNTGQKNFNQSQLEAIEDFIGFDGGDRQELCDEIWEEARQHIKYDGWQRIARRALDSLANGYSNNVGLGL